MGGSLQTIHEVRQFDNEMEDEEEGLKKMKEMENN